MCLKFRFLGLGAYKTYLFSKNVDCLRSVLEFSYSAGCRVFGGPAGLREGAGLGFRAWEAYSLNPMSLGTPGTSGYKPGLQGQDHGFHGQKFVKEA